MVRGRRHANGGRHRHRPHRHDHLLRSDLSRNISRRSSTSAPISSSTAPTGSPTTSSATGGAGAAPPCKALAAHARAGERRLAGDGELRRPGMGLRFASGIPAWWRRPARSWRRSASGQGIAARRGVVRERGSRPLARRSPPIAATAGPNSTKSRLLRTSLFFVGSPAIAWRLGA